MFPCFGGKSKSYEPECVYRAVGVGDVVLPDRGGSATRTNPWTLQVQGKQAFRPLMKTINFAQSFGF